MTIQLASRRETRQLGRLLGAVTSSGGVIALSGEVGSGKTTLAKAILGAWQVEGAVSSPTYTLIHAYPHGVYHVDLYRLRASEVADLGLEELWQPGVRAVVEWADRAASLLPADRLEVRLSVVGTGRQAELLASGGQAEAELRQTAALWRRR